jgi:response regulator of citrate/malate metabolism
MQSTSHEASNNGLTLLLLPSFEALTRLQEFRKLHCVKTNAMNEPLSLDQAFIKKLTDIILANLQNEQFGVEELSRQAGMSHITIRRKL